MSCLTKQLLFWLLNIFLEYLKKQQLQNQKGKEIKKCNSGFSIVVCMCMVGGDYLDLRLLCSTLAIAVCDNCCFVIVAILQVPQFCGWNNYQRECSEGKLKCIWHIHHHIYHIDCDLHVLQALKNGLTANQILKFIQLHAHSQMLANVSELWITGCVYTSELTGIIC